jgi:hypothetical protein
MPETARHEEALALPGHAQATMGRQCVRLTPIWRIELLLPPSPRTSDDGMYGGQVCRTSRHGVRSKEKEDPVGKATLDWDYYICQF